MTVAELARADQAAAKEREFENRAALIARYILGAFLILAGYALLVTAGWLPATPWSPMGQVQQQQYEQPAPPAPVASVEGEPVEHSL